MKIKLYSLLALTALCFSAWCDGPLETPAVQAVRQGNFDLAMKLFKQEVKQAPTNKQLKKAYIGLVATRHREKAFAREKNPAMAQRIGWQLRKFYYFYEIYAKAEPVDKKLYELNPSTTNTVNYGVTLLNIKKNQAALQVFSQMDMKKASPKEKLYAAQAYARMNQFAEAKKICQQLPFAQLDLDQLKLYARITALAGDDVKCAQAVTKILEQTHAKHHADLKKLLFADSDFDKVAKSPAYQKALKTASKAKDECAGCTRRGTSRCDDN